MTQENASDPDELISRIVDAFERMPVPRGPSARETIDALEHRAPGALQQQTPGAPIGPTIPSRSKRRFAAVGFGLSAVLAASLAILAIPSSIPGPPSPAQAFGMFADAIVGAKSAEFQLEVDVTGQGKQKLQSYYLAPGRMRSEMPGVVSILDLKTGKTLNLLPEQKTALVITVKNIPSEPGRPHFDDFFEELRNLLSKRRDTMDVGVTQLGEKEIDGHRAVGFRCESPVATVTLWGDPATGLPLLVESVLTGIPHIEVTMSRFFFNGHLDPALFATTPPADYKVQAFDLDLSKPTETALIEGLRMSADLNEGVFADSLDSANDYARLLQSPKKPIGDGKEKLRDMAPELMTIGRGMTFAAELPESADAHYAGKGIKLGTPNHPIFWYKPEGATTYRVIYADLSVKLAERAPEVTAEPLLANQESTFQAFNMFAEAFANARSATFRTVWNVEGGERMEAKSYYLAPGKEREDELNGTIEILDTKAGKKLILTPKGKRAVVMNYINRAKKPDKPQLIDLFEQMRDLLAETRDAKEEEFMRYVRLGEKQIDGRRAIGFRYTSPVQSLTLWGDPATGLPVLIESGWIGSDTPKNMLTMSHFELNEKLDPALFDTTPPADYEVQTVDIDFSKPTEQALVEALRLVTDLNDGVFVDKLDGAMGLVVKQAVSDEKNKVKDAEPQATKRAVAIGRGTSFALKLPALADAHYAGKGVKLGEPDRPIFWYKPAGAKTYRVIYADLSVQDAASAPEVAAAQKVGAAPLLASQESTFQAFNMFAEALVDARSATFQMEVKIEGQEKQTAESLYLAPGKMRTTAKGMVMLFDTKAGKTVFLSDKKKTAIVTNLKNRPREPGKPQLDDVFEQMRDLLSKSRDAKEDEFKQLGEQEIDGRRAIGFSYATASQSLVLWGDPATGLPVRIECEFSGKPRTEVTMSHFELNEKLDPALFDTTPPADYKVQTFDVDASKPTEQALIEALRLAADANDGAFMNHLDMASMMAAMIKLAEKSVRDRKEKSTDVPPEVVNAGVALGRGMAFAMDELPESADAHYAGNGVKLGDPDRPIFWYKPEGAKTYRVIYADLSVKEAETAPEVAGAVRLEKTKPAEKRDEPELRDAADTPEEQPEKKPGDAQTK